jgi:hypothetical protein
MHARVVRACAREFVCQRACACEGRGGGVEAVVVAARAACRGALACTSTMLVGLPRNMVMLNMLPVQYIDIRNA